MATPSCGSAQLAPQRCLTISVMSGSGDNRELRPIFTATGHRDRPLGAAAVPGRGLPGSGGVRTHAEPRRGCPSAENQAPFVLVVSPRPPRRRRAGNEPAPVLTEEGASPTGGVSGRATLVRTHHEGHCEDLCDRVLSAIRRYSDRDNRAGTFLNPPYGFRDVFHHLEDGTGPGKSAPFLPFFPSFLPSSRTLLKVLIRSLSSARQLPDT